LEKLEAQDWLELFTNSKRGCYVPKLIDFYANCVVINGVVTSIVNGHKLRFDASDLSELLRVPSEGFDVYVREDKSVLGDERLLELTQRLVQKPYLNKARSVRKRETTPLHQLLFWFVIKDVVHRGQGRNLADPMDMCLLDSGEKLNLRQS